MWSEKGPQDPGHSGHTFPHRDQPVPAAQMGSLRLPWHLCPGAERKHSSRGFLGWRVWLVPLVVNSKQRDFENTNLKELKRTSFSI